MNNKSFTLLELIIVLALLAILASVAVAKFVDLANKANGIVELTTMDSFRTAVLLYKARYDNFPDWPMDSSPTTPGPFDLLDSPPSNISYNEPGGSNVPSGSSGGKWVWARAPADGTYASYPNATVFEFYCPHWTGGLAGQRVGTKWVYVLTAGRMSWRDTCGGSAIYSPGAVIRCQYTPLNHSAW